MLTPLSQTPNHFYELKLDPFGTRKFSTILTKIKPFSVEFLPNSRVAKTDNGSGIEP